MNDTEFKLSDRFFSDLRRLTLTQGAPVAAIAVAVGTYVASRDAHMDSLVILIAGGLLALVSFGVWRGYHRQAASFHAYRIVLGHDMIRRSQPNLPEMTIPRDRITRIVRAPGRGLTVWGAGPQDLMAIPESLEGFDTLETTLMGWHAFEQRTATLAAWFPMISGLATIALFAFVMLSASRFLVTAGGVALVALLTSVAVVLQRSRHVDARTRRVTWFMPLCILVIVVRIWMVWTR